MPCPDTPRKYFDAPPPGYLIRFFGPVLPGDLEWTCLNRWQPVHSSLVGTHIGGPLIPFVAHKVTP